MKQVEKNMILVLLLLVGFWAYLMVLLIYNFKQKLDNEILAAGKYFLTIAITLLLYNIWII